MFRNALEKMPFAAGVRFLMMHSTLPALWLILGIPSSYPLCSSCGISGGAGNLLSSDPSMHHAGIAQFAAVTGMAFSVPGWACLLVGQ